MATAHIHAAALKTRPRRTQKHQLLGRGLAAKDGKDLE
jgi:hypothetical protein